MKNFSTSTTEMRIEDTKMKRLTEVKIAHFFLPLLRRLFGKESARKFCNRFAGEEWIFEREIFDPEVKRTTCRGFIALPGGCHWDGCLFCPYKSAVEKYAGKEIITSQELKYLFDIAFSLIGNCDVLEIWTGGSFFWEIPPETREYMLNKIAQDFLIRKVRVESLPSFVKEDEIRRALRLLGEKKLDVAIGLETQNDELRAKLGKLPVMEKAMYENAVRLLKKMKARSSTYVLLKPLPMPEKEAIEEAIRTIQYAFSSGTDEVLLQVTFVAEGAPLKNLWEKGQYSPPSLWSVVEVLKQTAGLGPVYLGEFQDIPPPLAGPASCPKCQPILLERFKKYRQTLGIDWFNNLPECECRYKN